MALLFMDGFDAGDAATKGYTTISPSSLQNSSDTRFSQGSSMYIPPISLQVYRSIQASTQVFVGFAAKVPQYSGALSFCGDAGATVHLTLSIGTTGMTLARGGTTLGSYTNGFTTWGSYIEFGATISDTVGTASVRLNGVEVISFSGDTKNGGTSTNIDQLYIFGNGIYLDDLYVCNSTGSAPNNTFLGDVRVRTLTPNGAGSSTQMTPSSGANYSTVDELPYSASDYVTASIGQQDLYATADLPTSPGTIFGLQTNIISKKTDAGSISGRTVLKVGTTTSQGTPTSLGTSDQTLSKLYEQNPDTSSTWTESDVNSIEIGTEASA